MKYDLKRKNSGIYFIEWNENGTRHRHSLKTRDDKQAQVEYCKQTGMLYKIERIVPKKVKPKKVTFQDAVNEYMWEKYGLKNVWSHKFKACCTSPQAYICGTFKRYADIAKIRYVEDITYSSLTVFVSVLKNEFKPATVNNHIARLRRLCKDFAYKDYLNKNHAEHLETYKPKTPKRYSFTKDEWSKVQSEASPRFQPFFGFPSSFMLLDRYPHHPVVA